MDTINNRKITLDADLLLDAEMQTLEGGVASEGCAVDHSENSTIQAPWVAVVHATKLKVAKHTLNYNNYNICHCIKYHFWCSGTKT